MSTYAGGIAFFAPLSPRRFFFPWRPLTGAPESMRSSLALSLAWRAGTELLCIWVPSLLFIGGVVRARAQREKGA